VFSGQLGGDEEFGAGNPRGGDGAADGGFVAVDRGGVDEPAADFQRRRHRALGLLVGQIRDAQAQRRNRVLVIEGNGWDGGARLASQRHSPACGIEGLCSAPRLPLSSSNINTSKLLAIRKGWIDWASRYYRVE